MALSALEANTISKAMQAAKICTDQLKPLLDGIDIIYNSSGGASSTITQDNLNATPSLSGLTKQQLDDGVYALTATLKSAITTAYTQLEQLSARSN